MPKFFFETENFDGNYISLKGETAHHIVNVLRYSAGDTVLLCDGKNTDYITKLVYTDEKIITAKFEVLETKKSLAEPPVFIRLYQSVIKWENFDFAIQKSVEVGASEIVPTVTKRSIYKITDVKKKTERFNRIAKSAAEQSLRGIIPRVTEPMDYNDTLNKTPAGFYACCKEKSNLTCAKKGFIMPQTHASIWIGPEGGFTDEERESFKSNDIIPFSLGPRTLRSETASIVSIVNLLMIWGGF